MAPQSAWVSEARSSCTDISLGPSFPERDQVHSRNSFVTEACRLLTTAGPEYSSKDGAMFRGCIGL